MASLCGLTRPPRQVLPHPKTGRGEEEHPNNEHPNPSTDAASINRTAEQDRAVDAVDASIKNRVSSRSKTNRGERSRRLQKKNYFWSRLNMKTTSFDEECLMLQGKGFADETSQGFGQGKLPAATVMKIQKLRKIREVRPNLPRPSLIIGGPTVARTTHEKGEWRHVHEQVGPTCTLGHYQLKKGT